jgi:hypothetical protein
MRTKIYCATDDDVNCGGVHRKAEPFYISCPFLLPDIKKTSVYFKKDNLEIKTEFCSQRIYFIRRESSDCLKRSIEK